VQEDELRGACGLEKLPHPIHVRPVGGHTSHVVGRRREERGGKREKGEGRREEGGVEEIV
jgi:hypothetical protein